jgi:predicted transcriptional regulator
MNTLTAPSNGTETSDLAATSVEPHLERLELLVRDAIAGSPHGLTCDEVEQETGLSHQTASARLNSLWNDNLIVRTDRKRKTRSGRLAFVYVTA